MLKKQVNVPILTCLSILIPFSSLWLFCYQDKPFLQLTAHWKEAHTRLAPALMELQGPPCAPGHCRTHASPFLPPLFIISLGFSFPSCLLPEVSHILAFKLDRSEGINGHCKVLHGLPARGSQVTSEKLTCKQEVNYPVLSPLHL